MKRIIIFISLLLFLGSINAQESTKSYKFRLYLKDKGISDYVVSEPEKFLSKQAIERKKRQGVAIDESDLPISNDYFNLLTAAGAEVVSHSKWFKTIVVQLNDSSQIDNLTNLSFVESAKYVWRGPKKRENLPTRPRILGINCPDNDAHTDIMGLTEAQFVMHNAKKLYQAGFSGIGINIAVIDAGFTNVDVIPYFESNQIIETKSFVPYGEVLVDSDHGTKVFSTISAVVPGKMMGSSPGANFYLLHSEDVNSEFPVEEDYWVRAVEYADSVGVDVINSSLGYTSFDDKSLSYTHDDLDGRTSLMSLAADMAYDKGMIVVTSAGNDGSKPWKKVSMPGDAAKALTVGAVSTDSIIAPFSSMGFTADNRIKPDVVSVGRGTITISQNGRIVPAGGTSFSSPFMAGFIATLWSINPELDRGELLDIIRSSGDRYHNPDSVYGHGIPDMSIAMGKVLSTIEVFDANEYDDDMFSVVNVKGDNLVITLKDEKFGPQAYGINLFDETGSIISQHIFDEKTINILLGNEIREGNSSIFVHFVAPHKRKLVRLKL